MSKLDSCVLNIESCVFFFAIKDSRYKKQDSRLKFILRSYKVGGMLDAKIKVKYK